MARREITVKERKKRKGDGLVTMLKMRSVFAERGEGREGFPPVREGEGGISPSSFYVLVKE